MFAAERMMVPPLPPAPRENGTTIVPVRSVSGLVNMTAVRWTVSEVSIPVGTKTGVPAVDFWSRLSMERKVC